LIHESNFSFKTHHISLGQAHVCLLFLFSLRFKKPRVGIFVPQLPSVAEDERLQSRPAEFSAEAHGRSQDQNLRAAATWPMTAMDGMDGMGSIFLVKNMARNHPW